MLVQQEQALYSLASTKLMNSEPNGNMKMARAGPIAANGRKKKFRLIYRRRDSRTRTVKCKERSGDCFSRMFGCLYPASDIMEG